MTDETSYGQTCGLAFLRVGMVAGGFVPALWGGSSLGFASLVFGTLGGAAGLWLAGRQT